MHNFDQKINKDSKKAKQKQLKKKKIKEILEEQVNEVVKNQPIQDKQEKVSKTAKSGKEKGNKKRQTTSFEDFVKMSEAHLFNAGTTPKTRKVSPVYEEFLNSEFEHSGLRGTPGDKKRKVTPEKKIKKTRNSLDALNNLPTKNPNSFVRNSGIWMVEELAVPESPATTPEKKKNSDWSKPLANGETEYFVVSSKAKKKLKRLSQGLPEKTTPKSSKNRNSLVKNPFSVTANTSFLKTPKSEKKIKFSTLNHSQDFSEHLRQVISSPAVPFDAKKRPNKPLLKPSPMTSPINALHFTKLH